MHDTATSISMQNIITMLQVTLLVVRETTYVLANVPKGILAGSIYSSKHILLATCFFKSEPNKLKKNICVFFFGYVCINGIRDSIHQNYFSKKSLCFDLRYISSTYRYFSQL